MDLNKKNAIITGGTGGIGYQIARQLFQQGVEVLGLFDIADKNNVAQSLAEQFPNKTCEFFKTDVTQRSNVKESFDAFIGKYNRVDIVIGSAGISNENSPETVISINLLGIVNSTYEAIDHMSLARGGQGGIVANVASTLALSYHAFAPVYNASKHGVKGFTKSLANEVLFKKYGITFLTICPGATETSMIENIDQKLYSDFLEEGIKMIKTGPVQTAEQMAKECMIILKKNKNGSIWIIENGLLQEFESKD